MDKGQPVNSEDASHVPEDVALATFNQGPHLNPLPVGEEGKQRRHVDNNSPNRPVIAGSTQIQERHV
jgi:hypothetical protein